MKLYVPEIGTVLQLEKDWEFTLYTERRNAALAKAAGFNYDLSDWIVRSNNGEESLRNGWRKAKSYYDWQKEMTLPAGTILTLDRIYIRKGVSEFSSLSFNLTRKSVNPDYSDFAKNIYTMTGRCRFWAKLNDVNKIEFCDLQAS